MVETKRFTIHVYRVDESASGSVQVPFGDVLKTAYEKSWSEEAKLIAKKPRRVNNFEQRGDVLLLNFVTMSYSGPAVTRDQEPIYELDLGDDEFFANQIAMLYDPQRRLVFLESSRGLTPNVITRYLASFTNKTTSYDMVAVADPSIVARAMRYSTLHRFELAVDFSLLDESARMEGLGLMAGLAEGLDGSTATVQISVSAHSSAGDSKTASFIRRAINTFGRQDQKPAVKKLKAWGKLGPSDPVTPIDLVQDRAEHTRTLRVVSKHGVPLADRWDALIDYRNHYISGT